MMLMLSEVLRNKGEYIIERTSEFSQKVLHLLRYLLQIQVPGKLWIPCACVIF